MAKLTWDANKNVFFSVGKIIPSNNDISTLKRIEIKH
jgi:hypothetical protein